MSTVDSWTTTYGGRDIHRNYIRVKMVASTSAQRSALPFNASNLNRMHISIQTRGGQKEMKLHCKGDTIRTRIDNSAISNGMEDVKTSISGPKSIEKRKKNIGIQELKKKTKKTKDLRFARLKSF